MASNLHGLPDSPCIGVCSTLFDDVCKGCGRMAGEVSNWVFLSDAEKARYLGTHYPRRHRHAFYARQGLIAGLTAALSPEADTQRCTGAPVRYADPGLIPEAGHDERNRMAWLRTPAPFKLRP